MHLYSELCECFRPEDVLDSTFDAVPRIPVSAICLFRVGFRTDKGHMVCIAKYSRTESVTINGDEVPHRDK